MEGLLQYLKEILGLCNLRQLRKQIWNDASPLLTPIIRTSPPLEKPCPQKLAYILFVDKNSNLCESIRELFTSSLKSAYRVF